MISQLLQLSLFRNNKIDMEKDKNVVAEKVLMFCSVATVIILIVVSIY